MRFEKSQNICQSTIYNVYNSYGVGVRVFLSESARCSDEQHVDNDSNFSRSIVTFDQLIP
jgi:hypothetical protein